MQGPMVPLRWGPDRQQTAYNALGFDPDNPLVKAEISRILARGKNPIRVDDATGIGSELDMLLLGYSEEVIGMEATFDQPVTQSIESSENKELQVAPVHPVAESGTSNLDVDSELAANEPIPSSEAQAGTVQTRQNNSAGRPTRTILVILAGFCVLALLGGICVLFVGRNSR